MKRSSIIEEESKTETCYQYDLYFYRYLNLDLSTKTSTLIPRPTGPSPRPLSRPLPRPLPSFYLYQVLYSVSTLLSRFLPLHGYRFSLLASLNLEIRFDRRTKRERIKVVERMEQMKILKGVDLQRMVQRFNAQREYIEAVGTGKSVEPPVESIHDTWLSVLGITDEMLAISREEMRNYIQYLRAVELIVACKEAAGRVSPEVWQEIEDRLLAWDAEDLKVKD